MLFVLQLTSFAGCLQTFAHSRKWPMRWNYYIIFCLPKSLQYVPNFEKIKSISGNLVFSLTTVRISMFFFLYSGPENNNNNNNNNISNWKVSICTIKNNVSTASYCKLYRICHWSKKFLYFIKNELSNLCRNLVLLNRILHGLFILISSTAVGCFSKPFFVTPQVNRRERNRANVTSKLFIPHH